MAYQSFTPKQKTRFISCKSSRLTTSLPTFVLKLIKVSPPWKMFDLGRFFGPEIGLDLIIFLGLRRVFGKFKSNFLIQFWLDSILARKARSFRQKSGLWAKTLARPTNGQGAAQLWTRPVISSHLLRTILLVVFLCTLFVFLVYQAKFGLVVKE